MYVDNIHLIMYNPSMEAHKASCYGGYIGIREILQNMNRVFRYASMSQYHILIVFTLKGRADRAPKSNPTT